MLSIIISIIILKYIDVSKIYNIVYENNIEIWKKGMVQQPTG